MPQRTRLSWRLRRKVQSQRLIALLVTQILQTAVIKLVCWNKYALFFKGRIFTAEVDWDCSNSSLREESALRFVHFTDFVFSFDMLGSEFGTSWVYLLVVRWSRAAILEETS